MGQGFTRLAQQKPNPTLYLVNFTFGPTIGSWVISTGHSLDNTLSSYPFLDSMRKEFFGTVTVYANHMNTHIFEPSQNRVQTMHDLTSMTGFHGVNDCHLLYLQRGGTCIHKLRHIRLDTKIRPFPGGWLWNNRITLRLLRFVRIHVPWRLKWKHSFVQTFHAVINWWTIGTFRIWWLGGDTLTLLTLVISTLST